MDSKEGTQVRNDRQTKGGRTNGIEVRWGERISRGDF
jgi:hypothetical protein